VVQEDADEKGVASLPLPGIAVGDASRQDAEDEPWLNSLKTVVSQLSPAHGGGKTVALTFANMGYKVHRHIRTMNPPPLPMNPPPLTMNPLTRNHESHLRAHDGGKTVALTFAIWITR
jgi:hypothetical protein